MANRIIPKELTDWSELNKHDPFFNNLDLSNEKNFGIHQYNGQLWTSGYVGIGRLYSKNGRVINSSGKEHVAIIRSQYHLDPWVMLEKVMTDDEYEDYIKELEDDGKYLFKVFYDQPVIKLNQDQNCDSDILYALSFINQAYLLCKKGIKNKMVRHEENFVCKIRGRIDVKSNIRKNTCNGRNDRFYCKYIDFTIDTIENRILKATLTKCKRTIEDKFEMSSEIMKRLFFCMNALKSVKTVQISSRDFNNANTSGLYIYYKPLLKLAKAILGQKYKTYIADDGNSVSKSVYTIPYMINMEAVFEFYVRTVIRKSIDSSRFYLDDYSKRLYLQKGVTDVGASRTGIHLMSYCIPDIIIREVGTNKPVVVMDAKYKKDDKPVRADSHQLLSYVLLTGAEKCGFILPGMTTAVKSMGNSDYLELSTPLINSLKYFELLLGEIVVSREIEKILN